MCKLFNSDNGQVEHFKKYWTTIKSDSVRLQGRSLVIFN